MGLGTGIEICSKILGSLTCNFRTEKHRFR